MPYQQPTLSDLFAQGLNDVVASNVTAGKSLLSRSILRGLVWMLANLVWGNYDYLAWCYRQAVPSTATDENLDAWGAMRGVTRKDATAAQLSLVSSGGGSNVDLPAGTTIARSDSLTYVTIADASTDASGSVACVVVCDTPGSAGNCDAGTAFTLQNAITGINAEFSVTGSVVSGTDQELDSDLRTRILQAFASRDGGGRAIDYVEWAESTPGVTRAWCNPNGFGAGTVVVYVMLDDARSAFNGFPQGVNGSASDEGRYTTASGDQLEVANAIRPEQPVTALVIVCAPIAQPVPITLTGLTPNTTDQIAAINAALTDLYLRIGTPLGMSLDPSAVEGAILSTGATTFTMVSPTGPIEIPAGSLPTLGPLVIQ